MLRSRQCFFGLHVGNRRNEPEEEKNQRQRLKFSEIKLMRKSETGLKIHKIISLQPHLTTRQKTTKSNDRGRRRGRFCEFLHWRCEGGEKKKKEKKEKKTLFIHIFSTNQKKERDGKGRHLGGQRSGPVWAGKQSQNVRMLLKLAAANFLLFFFFCLSKKKKQPNFNL